LQQADLRVGDAQIALHRRNQQAQDLAVDQRQRIAQHQDKNDVPGISAREGAIGVQCD